jgi:hypothetical protein
MPTFDLILIAEDPPDFAAVIQGRQEINPARCGVDA